MACFSVALTSRISFEVTGAMSGASLLDCRNSRCPWHSRSTVTVCQHIDSVYVYVHSPVASSAVRANHTD